MDQVLEGIWQSSGLLEVERSWQNVICNLERANWSKNPKRREASKISNLSIRTMVLASVESHPILLIRFTPKAKRDLIQLTIDRLAQAGIILVVSEGYEDGNGADKPVVLGLTTSQDLLENKAELVKTVKPSRTQNRQIPSSLSTLLWSLGICSSTSRSQTYVSTKTRPRNFQRLIGLIMMLRYSFLLQTEHYSWLRCWMRFLCSPRTMRLLFFKHIHAGNDLGMGIAPVSRDFKIIEGT